MCYDSGFWLREAMSGWWRSNRRTIQMPRPLRLAYVRPGGNIAQPRAENLTFALRGIREAVSSRN